MKIQNDGSREEVFVRDKDTEGDMKMKYLERMSPTTYALKGTRLAILEGRDVLELADYYIPLLLIESTLLPFGI